MCLHLCGVSAYAVHVVYLCMYTVFEYICVCVCMYRYTYTDTYVYVCVCGVGAQRRIRIATEPQAALRTSRWGHLGIATPDANLYSLAVLK